MRIVIAEDEALLREGLAALFGDAGVEVVERCSDAVSLVTAAARPAVDLVVTDIRMPPGHGDDGLRAALAVRAARPGLPVVVLSQHVQRRYALELVSDGAGAVGYLLKQRVADVEGFVADVHRVAGGATLLDPEVVTVMMRRAARGSGLEALTARQREVLALAAEGRSNAAIARRLVLGEKSVVQHMSRIYDLLGLPPAADDHRRVLAVVRFLNADG